MRVKSLELDKEQGVVLIYVYAIRMGVHIQSSINCDVNPMML